MAKIDTIEKLATLMVDSLHEFEERINHRFDTVEFKLQNIDARLTALENKVLGIERRLDNESMERLDSKAIFERLSKLEEAVFRK